MHKVQENVVVTFGSNPQASVTHCIADDISDFAVHLPFQTKQPFGLRCAPIPEILAYSHNYVAAAGARNEAHSRSSSRRCAAASVVRRRRVELREFRRNRARSCLRGLISTLNLRHPFRPAWSRLFIALIEEPFFSKHIIGADGGAVANTRRQASFTWQAIFFH